MGGYTSRRTRQEPGLVRVVLPGGSEESRYSVKPAPQLLRHARRGDNHKRVCPAARQEFQELVPRTVFLGYIAGRDLSTAYVSSDVLHFPSTTETFANVVVKAMAPGVPPICADQGGAHGIVNHGISGLITAARNPVDLDEKMELLLNDRCRREAMAAEAYRVSQQYTWEHVHRILFEGYESVICAHPIRDLIRTSPVA